MQYQHDAGLESQYSFGSFNPEEDLQDSAAAGDPSSQDKAQGWGPAHSYGPHSSAPGGRIPYQQVAGWDQNAYAGYNGYAAHDPALNFGAVAPMPGYTYGYGQYGGVPYSPSPGLFYPPMDHMGHQPHRMPGVQGSPSQPYGHQPQVPQGGQNSRKLEIKPPHSGPKSRDSKGSHQAHKSNNKSGQSHNAAELAVKQALQGVIADGAHPSVSHAQEDKTESTTSSATAVEEQAQATTSEASSQPAAASAETAAETPGTTANTAVSIKEAAESAASAIAASEASAAAQVEVEKVDNEMKSTAASQRSAGDAASSEDAKTAKPSEGVAAADSAPTTKYKLTSPFANGKSDSQELETAAPHKDTKPHLPADFVPPTPAPSKESSSNLSAAKASAAAAAAAAAAAVAAATAPAAQASSKKSKWKNKELSSDLLDIFREGKQDPAGAAEATQQEAVAAAAAPAPAAEEEEDLDWEQRADDDIQELPSAVASKRDENVKRYSRDFLLNLQSKFTEPPKGLESGEFSKGSGGGGGGFDRGRGMDRDGRMERQSSVGRDDRWGRGSDGRGGNAGRRNPPPEGLAPPNLGGRRASGSLDDRWARGQALPPRGSVGTPSRNMPALHKADNRWQAGKVDAEDPEEAKKQRAFKSILNKLTPDNFDKLSKQIMDVGITHPRTLEGLIDQIFDKALIEVTFCELYSNLCQHLHRVLPEFDPEEGAEDGDYAKRKITFRRLLLNKCQEEFEKGERAMEAVEAREAKEKQDQGKTHKEEKEEGEITDDERAKKVADQQAAEEERKARRRALGNIQFIGHLYRQRMLIEKIMHSCIQKLLADANAPKLEDVECLCKLLSTAGQMLDTEKNSGFMSAYFVRIQSIRELPTLESRLKFMLQDIIDMRANKWEARRKQEGPKKIEDVHREAQAEMQRAASGPLRGGPGERGERGDRRGGDRRGSGGDPWSNQAPAYDRGRMPIRRDEEPPRPLQRSSLTSTTTDFRPQGISGGRTGLSQGGGDGAVSLRPQGTGIGITGRSAKSSTPADNLSRAATAPPTALDDKPSKVTVSADDLKKIYRQAQGVWEDCRAYESNTTTSSIASALTVFLKEKKQGAITTSVILSRLVLAALNIRGVEPPNRLKPLQAVLLALLASGDISNRDLEASLLDLIAGDLVETKEDFPKSPELLGEFLVTFLEQGVLQLSQLGKALLSGEPEPGCDDAPLIDSEAAQDLLLAVLKNLKPDVAEKMWRSAGLSFAKFVPSFEDSDAVIKKSNLAFLK